MYEEEKVIEVSKEKSNTSEKQENRFFEKYAEKGRVIQTRIIIDEYIYSIKGERLLGGWLLPRVHDNGKLGVCRHIGAMCMFC